MVGTEIIIIGIMEEVEVEVLDMEVVDIEVVDIEVVDLEVISGEDIEEEVVKMLIITIILEVEEIMVAGNFNNTVAAHMEMHVNFNML